MRPSDAFLFHIAQISYLYFLHECLCALDLFLKHFLQENLIVLSNLAQKSKIFLQIFDHFFNIENQPVVVSQLLPLTGVGLVGICKLDEIFMATDVELDQVEIDDGAVIVGLKMFIWEMRFSPVCSEFLNFSLVFVG